MQVHFAVFFQLMLFFTLMPTSEGKAKRNINEPDSQFAEPPPVEGDCPCSKIACVGDKGLKGDKGDVGPEGPQGPKGEQGPNGSKGPQGDKGVIGPRGPKGLSGTPGKNGLPGKAGVNGSRGAVGPRGPQGLTGAQGPRGPEGPQGNEGPKGSPGAVGKQGDKGYKGNKGGKGDRGAPGQNGAKGPQGPPGDQGPRGPEGPQGNKGPEGPRGKTSSPGPRGPQGATGSIGTVGPRGHKGSQGPQGNQGKPGADGKQGVAGPQGLRGERGSQGTPGSCTTQCADIKKQLLKEIENLRNNNKAQIKELQKQIDELKPKPTTKPTQPTNLPTPPRGKLGTLGNPGRSCKHIKERNIRARSGKYYVVTDTVARKSLVYCYMESLGMCGGGGWTPVMKINGKKQTFRYESPLWTNRLEYKPNYGLSAFSFRRVNFAFRESKTATYWSTPFTRVCIGMRTARYSMKFIRIDYSAKSLYDVIADGKYKATSNGRESWKRLVHGASLQKNCNREGFNIQMKLGTSSIAARARIGIASNQEYDCESCDSRIGVGTDGSLCGQDDTNSCGNEARCSPDNGNKSIKTYGLILVQ